MITCVVTALVAVEERERKQTLRLVGVILGGVYGLAAVIFFIPWFDLLMGLLMVLGLGTAMAAWLSTGSKRHSYAGWQTGLALFITILQDPHPVTELDVIWNRFVGIVLGGIAMPRIRISELSNHLPCYRRRLRMIRWTLRESRYRTVVNGANGWRGDAVKFREPLETKRRATSPLLHPFDSCKKANLFSKRHRKSATCAP